MNISRYCEKETCLYWDKERYLDDFVEQLKESNRITMVFNIKDPIESEFITVKCRYYVDSKNDDSDFYHIVISNDQRRKFLKTHKN